MTPKYIAKFEDGKAILARVFADLLGKLNDDFGLDEVTAKTLLKEELGYTGYKSEKFQEMYDSVQAIIPKGEAAPVEDTLGFMDEGDGGY